MASPASDHSREPIVVRRVFHADANELFRAWIEPERLRRWLQPIEGVAAGRVAVEARPGGSLVMEFGAPRAHLSLRGRFRELAAPERLGLALVRRFEGSDDEQHTLVTLELEARSGTTRLELRHEGVRAVERAEIEHTWWRCLGRLVGECPHSLEHFYARLDGYPRFRSRFGGLWPDLSDAEARIAGKLALGLLTPADAALFRHWVEHGWVVLERAVAPELVERLRAEVERSWERGDERIRLECFENGTVTFPRLAPRYRDLPHKMLDYHSVSATAREIEFAPAIRRFLEQLFERPALAFQSLLFRWGSEQDMHQDSAYVVVRSPMEFVGCWIALEDVRPGSGELQYYDGSHRIPEFVWFERARARPYEYENDSGFLRWVREQSEAAGCELVRFHPKKGDALIWHADLVHGGAKRELAGVTRHSLVTHFSPVSVDPEYLETTPSSGKLEHAPGCYYCYPLREAQD